VDLGPQPINWIRKHRSFASKEWVVGQVRYGYWEEERNKPNNYMIFAEVIERREPIKVLIKIRHEQDYVLVYHVHVTR